jgi:hypothetical protein
MKTTQESMYLTYNEISTSIATPLQPSCPRRVLPSNHTRPLQQTKPLVILNALNAPYHPHPLPALTDTCFSFPIPTPDSWTED